MPVIHTQEKVVTVLTFVVYGCDECDECDAHTYVVGCKDENLTELIKHIRYRQYLPS